MEFEAVIGLEVHAELLTESKIFCSCTTEFGGEPNTHCCPVCLGLPGTLPVLNKKAVEYAIRAGLALNCNIARFSKMDRKNYFYPDLPKAYQISQYDLPLCRDGYVEIETENGVKKIGIIRVHLEEDAGKLIHDEGAGSSLVDYNRTGVPLIEIVSYPDMRTPEEARLYLAKLKSILEYTEVSDCKMQEGSLRVDTNISVRPVGSSAFGTKVELKNLNSFRAVYRALEYEFKRQAEAIKNGEEITQETRRWDENKGITVSMRSKEEAHDYRYFPEPDIVPIVVDDEWIEDIRRNIPELPQQKRERFINDLGLPPYDAGVITSDKALSDFFERCVELYDNPKTISNWVMGEILRAMKDSDIEASNLPVKPEQLVMLQELVDDGTISISIAKRVFDIMFKTGENPDDIVRKEGLAQISDEGALREIVIKTIKNNPKSVEDFLGGKEKAMGFLIGQVMKETKGKANPQMINEIMKEELSKISKN
ncbi:Asp-tRNA(Asn)/Glu-tRNA(Gln) amidotransferase subunit GatB [Calorimonas adulescens]|jgi:glutamyl-tRNA(Gln) and/or aspartyl-tRNA(Asn) amidotransferase, B subunit|uniref:Aspartyl/glutamyl-tRNA(Asn/Gln) amidotransferase subunit B n=1 Tax=Calorimonas adulescens TaxID=2606906 RepID=A0A5D8QB40_9THEO|nr:Asp-tRNA(Asn)/Glu-tRNA(Gln) amidotransferase subunit GatB [Calorimonas adulescens]TZE81702.1 Asp-tRNA(Asn)/Glu-tRNA(Gln) amidotransferase subunit GatB [Calorimonas adulescens]